MKQKAPAKKPNGSEHQRLPRELANEPVSRVEWVPRNTLTGNDYNPNHVAAPELELLKVSILEDGWTQPIVILPDNTIVDGFHRWQLAADPEIDRVYNGMVPVVRVVLDPVHRKMSTIRHNRARGTHQVLLMAKIVTEMITEGVTPAAIMQRLGMEDEEIIRLSVQKGMPEIAAAADFGKPWAPTLKS